MKQLGGELIVKIFKSLGTADQSCWPEGAWRRWVTFTFYGATTV